MKVRCHSTKTFVGPDIYRSDYGSPNDGVDSDAAFVIRNFVAERKRMGKHFVFDGLNTTDIMVSRSTVVDLRNNGVALKHSPTGQEWFIPTNGKPEEGAKVFAKEPLRGFLNTPIVENVVAGGGVVGAGTACAIRMENHKFPGKVRLLNSGNQTAELTAICAAMRMDCESFDRMRSPINLVLPQKSDRVVIKEPLTAGPEELVDGHFRRVARTVADGSALATVSTKDAGLTALAVSMSNGARRYFQPTGSLSPELTLLMLSVANEVVCNFEEWKMLAKWAGVSVPNFTESSDEAHKAAAELLSAMYERGLAATEAAVCTLGVKGSVGADWMKERVSRVSLQLLDGSKGLPTPSGAGDRFLGEWVFLRETWSRQGYLRHPIEATIVRITHSVANFLGLDRGQYDVEFARV